MSKVAITITTLILICSIATAQEFIRHEFSINMGGGTSCLQTRPTVGKNLWDWTGTAGFGYHFFFNPYWSIGTGANYFAIYNGGISIKNYNWQQDAINTTMGSNTSFDFLVSLPRYKETLQSIMFTIPLMVQYQHQFQNTEKMIYAAFGGKAGIPISANSQSKGIFTSNGYYPNLDVTYEDLPDYGFVTDQPFPAYGTNIGLKTALMASIEVGVKWRLGERASLYTGIYVDYGLNNILKKETTANTNLVVYQPNTPAQFAYNTASNLYAKQMTPFAGGITLRVAFGKEGRNSVRPIPTSVTGNNIAETQPLDDSVSEAKRSTNDETVRQQVIAEIVKEKDAVAEKVKEQVADAEKAKEQNEQYIVNKVDTRRQAEEDRLAKQQETKQQTMNNIQERPIDHYGLGEIELSETRKQELNKRIEFLKQNPDIDVFIYGHTCDIGICEANERVGLARAQKAKEYMISQGISENRIVGIASKRDTEPLVPTINEKNRRINRRIEIVVEQ